MISATSLLYADVCAAGVLAAWSIRQLRRFRPQSVAAALGLLAVAMVFAQVAPPLIPRLIALPGGMYLAMLGCVLPIFFFLFLTSGWLVVTIASLNGGSGGKGRRLPLPSRN